MADEPQSVAAGKMDPFEKGPATRLSALDRRSLGPPIQGRRDIIRTPDMSERCARFCSAGSGQRPVIQRQ
jgi:hypothetical protein